METQVASHASSRTSESQTESAGAAFSFFGMTWGNAGTRAYYHLVHRRVRSVAVPRWGIRHRFSRQTRRRNLLCGLLEMSQFAKDLIASVDLLTRQRLQPLRSEALDGERTHHAAVEKGALEHFSIQFLLGSHVSHEAAREGIARASGVLNLFDWKSGSAEWM